MSQANADNASLYTYYRGFRDIFGIDLKQLLPNISFSDESILDKRYEQFFRNITNSSYVPDFPIYTPLSLIADYEAVANAKRFFEVRSPLAPGLAVPKFTEAKEIKRAEKEITTLGQALQKEIENLPNSIKNQTAVVRFLAEKYLSAVGVNITAKKYDPVQSIPFYDILRFIAIGLATDENRHYRLALLDVSGIQDFVYNITSKRALASLRGRSIFLEVMAQTVLQQLLQVCGGNEDNIIVRAGGAYTLLLPTLSQTSPETQPEAQLYNLIIQQWNKRLFEWQEGRLALVFRVSEETQPFSFFLQLDTNRYKKLREKLTEQISNAKQQKFNGVLTMSSFEPDIPLTPCRICRRHPHPQPYAEKTLYDIKTKDEVQEFLVCDFCRYLIGLGGEVSRQESAGIPQQPAVSEKAPTIIDLKQDNVGWKLLLSKENISAKENENENEKWVRLLHQPVNLPDLPNLKIAFNPEIANDIVGTSFDLRLPLTDRDLKDFDEEAKKLRAAGIPPERGWQGAGALRADVDNMGSLIGSSGEGNIKKFPLLRAASISRLLNLFFSTYMMRLNPPDEKSKLEQKGKVEQFRLAQYGFTTKIQPRKFAIIYGGGDDMFGIGYSWADTLEFALDLARYWQDFTGNNPKATISMGLSLHNWKYPVAAMAEESGNLLKDRAKANKKRQQNNRTGNENSKNSLAVSFGRKPLFWDEILNENPLWREFLVPFYKLLVAEDAQQPTLSRAFLRRLLTDEQAIYPQKLKDWKPLSNPKGMPQGKVKLLYTLASFAGDSAALEKHSATKDDWAKVFAFLKALHANPNPSDLSFYLNWLDLAVRTTDDAAIKPTIKNGKETPIAKSL